MTTVFDGVACASLPLDALPLLASLRCEPGVEIARDAGRLWLRFEAGAERVLRGVLPLGGVELFAFRDGDWRRFGQSLPAFDFPRQSHFEPLYQVLFPAPVLPVPLGTAPVIPVRVALKADDRPRPTTAMLCPLAALQAWADTVPAARLERLHGVVRAGNILVIGATLPLLPGAERFWGKLVLVPLGFCPDPELPEDALREAAGVEVEELLLMRPERAEAVPRTALGRLSRGAAPGGGGQVVNRDDENYLAMYQSTQAYLKLSTAYCAHLGGIRWSTEDDALAYPDGRFFAFCADRRVSRRLQHRRSRDPLRLRAALGRPVAEPARAPEPGRAPSARCSRRPAINGATPAPWPRS